MSDFSRFDDSCEPGVISLGGSLFTYKSKRDFGETPEPEGEEAEGENKHRFVIQRHKAKRAGEHFDLRLENDDGAMSSWSVPKHKMPKGSDRLLAIQTEDHPLSYRTFSGTIPEGEYGAGVISIHDSGTYEEIEKKDGKIAFRLKGKKEKGTYLLFRENGKKWMFMEYDPDKKADDGIVSSSRASRIKAISVKQPWANMIADGRKTIETRTWATTHRGSILIVSSTRPAIPPAGCAVAIADLIDCRPMVKEDEVAAGCELYPSAYSWVLKNVRSIDPFKVKGSLGLYDVDMPEPPLFVRAKYIDKKKQDSGNITYIYSDKHVEKRNKQKASRLKRLSKSLSRLRDKVSKDMKDDDRQKAAVALAVAIIDETYTRVGNDGSAKDLNHYGLTTWLKKHVSFTNGKARIRFVGKSGVKQDREVTGKDKVVILKAMCDGKKASEKVFEGEGYKVRPVHINEYLKPFNISAKDIRGFHANKEMLFELKKVRKGKLPSEETDRKRKLKEEFKTALEAAADKVGHQAGTLKGQYLIPSIEPDYLKDGRIGTLVEDGWIENHADTIPEPLEKLIRPFI